ncbi:histidinol-phosphate phosphatase [Oceanithermus profundus DSM 14977]|uniref:Histidinol-phosphatase n=1 Tax=Oceanithermus profundus (strain DSM 14977 / NBRC 100410 / VKM B-2274 / 506) TaxID=670487 RepID=E4U5I5_OCEP5|nr:histidinol-phosphatase HisJ family protein [Oceanithermus profundus]ADR35488.1 histidinol-phosphate phosphatase [Oceanithermus profundus DSM 14977]
MYDSHVHTPLCQHAEGEPAAYLAAARERGLAGLVFTDHNPMPPWFDPKSRMGEAQLPLYHRLVEAVRAQAPDGFYVGLGLEADFHPGTEAYVRAQLEAYPYDYVIGSVHFIGAWPFDHPDFAAEFERRDRLEVYADYYALVYAAAESGLFDAIGHLDLPKKFGHLPPEEAWDLVEGVLGAIRDAGIALDVNTAGWRKPVGELYPAPRILRRARELGVPVVLGSDAHAPDEVGARFAEAAALLAEAGYREAWVYKNRKPEPYPLEAP